MSDVMGLQISPFGVIPKKGRDQWQLVLNFPSPHGSSRDVFRLFFLLPENHPYLCSGRALSKILITYWEDVRLYINGETTLSLEGTTQGGST